MPRNFTRKPMFRKRECIFCTDKVAVDYKDVERLRKLITERGKIISRSKTKTCSRHQHDLSVAVKRARLMALLPYSVKIEV